MPQPNDLSRSLVILEQDATLIAVIGMGQSSWLVAGIVPGVERSPLKKLAVDESALLKLLNRWREEAEKAGHRIERIAIAFEAGRDGFWLARWLRARGIEAHVIHASSVAVSREHRRAKTDRLDTELLKRAFLGWLRGERDHCKMVAIPTLAQEDAKRPNRERESLVGEQSRIVNRMKAALARLGIRGFNPKLKKAVERLDFRFIAIEGDWPDAARVDHYVRHLEYPPSEWTAFARFPTWMWRNNEVRDFVNWLREHNAATKHEARVAFHGLDLYSLYVSIRSVLNYLDQVDPEAAKVARQRYGCLTPWQGDPATYGHAALTGSYRTCEPHVVRALKELLEKRVAYTEHDGERFFDAVQNARLVTNAERYYRIMYYGSRASWNLRDEHMFTTLKNLLAFYGTGSKAIVWAHNSHVGDSAATEMALRGEHNIGHLCRQEFGGSAYLVGFGTNSGTVAAASDWDGPMEVKKVQPALPKSYERLCHASGHPRFMLGLRNRAELTSAQGLGKPQLERAIGVVYRPETERASHYFQAILPRQFDEYVWFDDTRAVTPFDTAELAGLPDTYPFGL